MTIDMKLGGGISRRACLQGLLGVVGLAGCVVADAPDPTGAVTGKTSQALADSQTDNELQRPKEVVVQIGGSGLVIPGLAVVSATWDPDSDPLTILRLDTVVTANEKHLYELARRIADGEELRFDVTVREYWSDHTRTVTFSDSVLLHMGLPGVGKFYDWHETFVVAGRRSAVVVGPREDRPKNMVHDRVMEARFRIDVDGPGGGHLSLTGPANLTVGGITAMVAGGSYGERRWDDVVLHIDDKDAGALMALRTWFDQSRMNPMDPSSRRDITLTVDHPGHGTVTYRAVTCLCLDLEVTDGVVAARIRPTRVQKT